MYRFKVIKLYYFNINQVKFMVDFFNVRSLIPSCTKCRLADFLYSSLKFHACVQCSPGVWIAFKTRYSTRSAELSEFFPKDVILIVVSIVFVK